MPNNFSEKANFIWIVADDTLCVRGAFKAHEYGDVILRHFRAFSTPKRNPALEVLSTPAHPQVTQTVETVEKVGKFNN